MANDNAMTSWANAKIQPGAGPMKFMNISTGGHNYAVIKKYRSTAGVFGNSSSRSDTQYEADVGANPTRRWYWIVCAAAFDISTAINVIVQVDMSYYVKFHTAKEQTQD